MPSSKRRSRSREDGTTRRIIRNWPKGGPRPVFPKAGDETALPAQPIVLTTVETVAVTAKPSLVAARPGPFFLLKAAWAGVG